MNNTVFIELSVTYGTVPEDIGLDPECNFGTQSDTHFLTIQLEK